MFIRSLVVLFSFIACTQAKQPDPVAQLTDSLESKPAFDSLVAAKWGADQYGMKPYVLVFLKRGPNRSQDSTTRAQLQAAHMANINRLAEAGKLVLAGPVFGDGDIRGIYVFDVRTLEEAKTLTETDPAIQAGSLTLEMLLWYGSAALMEIPKLHYQGAKIPI
ncbi:MAG: YciI family protein [Saprospiraceae bacterium]|nr:YciI family protein [Saprospiraceae bacterium]